MALAPIIIPAIVKQTATIIFLHGLGDTGLGWSKEIGALKPGFCKLICPTAPIRPITANGGSKMPAWYDVISFSAKGEDQVGIEESSLRIQQLIQEEVQRGIPENRIILGGFSQGAAMSMYTGLTGRYSLGGVLALSGYLPLFSSINWTEIKTPRILQCHGDKDDVVHIKTALATKTRLEERKYPKYEFKLYPGLDHSASPQELKDIKQFFLDVLGNVTIRSEL